jgi:hypothetical protein
MIRMHDVVASGLLNYFAHSSGVVIIRLIYLLLAWEAIALIFSASSKLILHTLNLHFCHPTIDLNLSDILSLLFTR